MIRAEPKRAVVRGSGSIGTRHAAVLRSLGLRVDVWPVRPRTANRGGEFVTDAQGPDRYADADLVVVATDTSRHVADALEALDRGARRVLVEKPVAPSAAEARPLSSHARSEAVSIAVPLRAHLAFSTVLASLEKLPGRLAVNVSCQSWLPDWRPHADYRASYAARPKEGGVLRDLIHEVDYATVLFGRPTVVGAVLDHDGPLEMPSDQAATAMWTTDRATVTMRLDYVTRPSSRRLEVRSSLGGLVWDVASGQVTFTQANGVQTVTRHDQDLDRDAVMRRQAHSLLTHEALGSVTQSTRLREGAPAILNEAVAAVAVCDDLRAADSTRRRG